MGTLLSIGAAAPEFVVRADRGTLAPASAGQPRVLAFVRDWSIECEEPDTLRRIRGELRGQESELRDFETVTLAEPYIELVRQRFGAPGSDHRRAGAQGGPSAAGGTEP